MKNLVSIALVAVLLAFTACGQSSLPQSSQTEPTPTPTQEIKAGLNFPTKEEFALIVNENIEDEIWQIGEIPEKWGDIPQNSSSERYYLYNKDKSVMCCLVTYKSPAQTNGINITFYHEEITPQQYQTFAKQELPQIWRILAKLSDNEVAMVELTDKIEKEYTEQIAQYTEGGLIEWGEQNSGIYATVKLAFNFASATPNSMDIKLASGQEYNYIASVDKSRITTIQDMVNNAENVKEQPQNYIIYGSLDNFEKADSIQDIYNNRYTVLPCNTNYYKKANLKDKSGNTLVYIAPTALTEQELSQERLHAIIALKDKNTNKIVYIVQRSVMYNIDNGK